MADYIYLLENRLSPDQRNALQKLREATREAGMILFLTGDAVRDLTSGHAVRSLEVAVHGDALKLKKIVEKFGATVWGESEPTRTLYLCFPGTVRADVVSTHRMDYTKLDKPVYHAASIHEDLRRRDFTVNAMAISLNEGSFGLLMDPLNGVADIEARTLRLVSNYGFLEEPSLLIRAARLIARLGWELDLKTRSRYDNAKEEGVIERITGEARNRELEQIGHEDDGLKILRALDEEGWMKVLFPAWTPAKADEEKLKALHDLSVELLLQGVHADVSAAQMQLLTAKLAQKDLVSLKQHMLRPGFVEEWNSLDAIAAKLAKVLLSKQNTTPSAGFKLLTGYDPEAVLWLGFTTKDKAVLERYNQFLKIWPEARQRIPHALMQEMRITQELTAYPEIVEALFLQLIDGQLTTPEEQRAFLEPHSPPAPPPQVTIKRPRAKRGEAKLKERAFDEDEETEDREDDDLDDMGGDDEEVDLGIALPKGDLDVDLADAGEIERDVEVEEEEAEDDEHEPPEPPPSKRGGKSAKPEKNGSAAKGAAAKPAEPAKGHKGAASLSRAIHTVPKAEPAAVLHAAQPARAKAKASSAEPVVAIESGKKKLAQPAPFKQQAPSKKVPVVKQPSPATRTKPAAGAASHARGKAIPAVKPHGKGLHPAGKPKNGPAKTVSAKHASVKAKAIVKKPKAAPNKAAKHPAKPLKKR